VKFSLYVFSEKGVCIVIALKVICVNVGKGLFGVIVVHWIVVEESLE
jgi:hypothetical protein